MPAVQARRARGARRAAAALVTTVALAATVTDDAPAAVPPGPVHTVAASRVLDVAGRGWGHGRGLSQYGAYGAATLGRSATQILDFYYPGTAQTQQGNPTMRVQLRSQAAADADRIDVANPGTLSFVDERTKATWKGTRATSARWRVVTSGASLKVQYLVGSTWTTSRTVTGPVRVDAVGTGATHVLHPLDRTYTGSYLRVSRVDATHLTTVDHTTMETYLRGVVPAESISSWPAATLQAQAIAARSYSAWHRAAAGSRGWDVCDTTACQVYAGDGAAVASTDAAVQATAGLIRTFGGKPVFAEFSSSNGGWTTAGDAPYLVAKADPWDGVTGASVHSWTARLPASAIEARWPALGTLRSLQVRTRDGHGDWGGRVGDVRLVGSRQTLVVSGRDVYLAWSWPAHATGLRSPWWDVRDPGADLSGDGVGDLAVGRPGSYGAIVTALGRTGSGVAAGGRLVSQASTGVVGTPEAGDGFGSALAAGDFDGDGRRDLAVGVPGEDIGSGAGYVTDAGSVQVLRGTTSGTTTGPELTLSTSGVPGVAVDGARFGAALAAGDLDGDGHDDLVVAVPGATVNGRAAAGAVVVLRGSRTGLGTARALQWVQSAGETPEAGDRLGA
ncbi:SpoIID/LytB domain-containing protein, partial [Angustibacter aerolatus]